MKSGFDALQSLDPLPPLKLAISPEFIASITSVESVLQWHDMMFVDIAYHIMLQREADVAGMRYYLNRVRDGRSRIAILDQLAKAPEANPRWTQVKGLQDTLTRYRASRRVFAGLWRRWTDPEIGDLTSFARTRATANSIGRTRQEIMLALERVIARQQDLDQLIVRQRTPDTVPEVEASAASNHVPRVLTVSDMQESDFNRNERRVLHALRV